jgi:hypothetical protein
MISPQLGHGNLADSVPGGMILWHDVHTGTVAVGFSVMVKVILGKGFENSRMPSLICAVLRSVCENLNQASSFLRITNKWLHEGVAFLGERS